MEIGLVVGCQTTRTCTDSLADEANENPEDTNRICFMSRYLQRSHDRSTHVRLANHGNGYFYRRPILPFGSAEPDITATAVSVCDELTARKAAYELHVQQCTYDPTSWESAEVEEPPSGRAIGWGSPAYAANVEPAAGNGWDGPGFVDLYPAYDDPMEIDAPIAPDDAANNGGAPVLKVDNDGGDELMDLDVKVDLIDNGVPNGTVGPVAGGDDIDDDDDAAYRARQVVADEVLAHGKRLQAAVLVHEDSVANSADVSLHEGSYVPPVVHTNVVTVNCKYYSTSDSLRTCNSTPFF